MLLKVCEGIIINPAMIVRVIDYRIPSGTDKPRNHISVLLVGQDYTDGEENGPVYVTLDRTDADRFRDWLGRNTEI